MTRKDEHIDLALTQDNTANDFSLVKFVPRALGTINHDDVDLSVKTPQFNLAVPFYINAMTGGSSKTEQLNRQLAIAAKETGIAMSTGSQMVALTEPKLADSFKIVRKENPKGFIFANISGNATLAQAQAAVEMVNANALQIHLNSIQEIVMPEGDRSFSHLKNNIEKIISGIQVPVVVKEVGFGLDRNTILELTDLGVKTVDLGGRGGTNFVQIENARRANFKYDYLQNWGISTVECLLDATRIPHEIGILASGGIQSPLDTAIAVALGADAVGVAASFLKILTASGVDQLIADIKNWRNQLVDIMVLLGCRDICQLQQAEVLLTGHLKQFCELRGIDPVIFANRRAQISFNV